MKPNILPKTAALVAVMLGTSLTVASAATCAVPTEYPTIQSAVDDPNCSAINVAPGVYNENVVITRSLLLDGARVGQPVADRVSASADESVLRGAAATGSQPVILIDAANVTVDGFTISNIVTQGDATGVRVTTNGSDAVVVNNFFDGISSSDAAAFAQAVSLLNGPDNVNVSRNSIQNVSGNRSAMGVWIGSRSSTNPSEDVLIKGNSFLNIASGAGNAAALLVDNGAGAARAQFHQNDIVNVSGSTVARGVDFQTNTGFSQVWDNNFTKIVGADVAAVWFNYVTYYQSLVTGNNFNLPITAYGIGVDAAVLAAAPQDNALNAACNWWGSPNGPGPVGPGSGARVSRLILFAPWRIAPAPDGECTGNNVPTAEMQCKGGGWTRAVRADGSTFKNQGDCIQYVQNGK